MITEENKIVPIICNTLRKKYGNDIFISVTEYATTPVRFPAVSIVLLSNEVNSKFSTFTHTENSVTEAFEVNVYSNLEKDNDKQCLEITEVISDAFSENFWIRFFNKPITNVLDETVARRTSRYKKII